MDEKLFAGWLNVKRRLDEREEGMVYSHISISGHLFAVLPAWLCLAWFGLVWFGLVWFGLVLHDLVWMKSSLRAEKKRGGHGVPSY